MPVLEAQNSPRTHISDPYARIRRVTRVVPVGTVLIGGNNPIRLQSMTTTDTLDTAGTVAQTLKMVEVGCEIVRITAPTVKSAKNLENIKVELEKRGCKVPLVADIHFDPAAAMTAADFVDKVRINPGNFVDSKRFAVREYTDTEYDAELARIEERFTPLVEKLKRLNRSVRIGTNHGSLSDRIMNRYGDSPLGMVESALEFVRICEKNDFHDIILSMKASNPKVMIAAYRMLAARMNSLGMDYPFHLGVTEAGDGEDGRVKSAVGIGSLLEDGIGDTIRVSLTEDPELEIPVCRELAAPYNPDAATPTFSNGPDAPYTDDCFDYKRRESDSIKVGPFRLGGQHPVRVITRWEAEGSEILSFLEAQLQAPQALEPEILEWHITTDSDCDSLTATKSDLASETSRIAFLARFHDAHAPWQDVLPMVDMAVYMPEILDRAKELEKPLLIDADTVEACLEAEAACRKVGVACVVSLQNSLLQDYRRLSAGLRAAGSRAPIHLLAPMDGLGAAVLLGSLLCDGIGDSVQVTSSEDTKDNLRLVYNILQATGVRITKTEYVSCPSCGRTLFDLQETTERIKSQTGHLKGVKIAIMGCIVNGPGEMADADFGYVGGAPGKINLYVGKECIQKGVPTADADLALIELIRTHGKWVEPANGEKA